MEYWGGYYLLNWRGPISGFCRVCPGPLVGKAEHWEYSLFHSLWPLVSRKKEMGSPLGLWALRADGGSASGVPPGLRRTG